MILHIALALLLTLSAACSTAPAVKSQAYAQLQNHRTFEYEFPRVWKGIEEAFKNYRILRRDPDSITNSELKKLKNRILETDWVYSQSREKYVEFKVNGFPQKKYLQTRVQFRVTAQKVLGGIEVYILTTEEVEKLKADGNPTHYEPSAAPDTSRAHEILEKIENSILITAQE